MDDATFIIASYVLTAFSLGAYAVWIMRTSRRLDAHATDEDKPWT